MSNTINDIIEKSIEGDENARGKLLQCLKPAILSAIRKYYNKYDIYDDLIQEGYEIILKGLADYDPSKKVHFLGYVKALLRYHYLSRGRNEKRTISLNQLIDTKDGEIELMETIADTESLVDETIIQRESWNDLRTSLSSLTQRQREVIVLYYLENYSINEISRKLGIGYRTVVNTKTIALRKLKNILQKLS